MKNIRDRVDASIFIMGVFLLVVFGMILQKTLGGPERLPTYKYIIEQEWQLEREEGKRRWRDYIDRRDSYVTKYQYASVDRRVR